MDRVAGPPQRQLNRPAFPVSRQIAGGCYGRIGREFLEFIVVSGCFSSILVGTCMAGLKGIGRAMGRERRDGLPLQIFALPALVTAFYLSMHNLTVQSDFFKFRMPEEIKLWQITTIFFVFVVSTTAYFRQFVQFGRLASIISLLIIYFLINIFVSIDFVRSTLFVGGFVVFLASMPAFWIMTPNDRRTSYLLCALCILLSSGYLFATLPLNVRLGRTVGEIPANFFSHGAVLAIVLTVMSRYRYWYVLVIPSLVLLGFANGRTAMASLLLFGIILSYFRMKEFGFQAIARLVGIILVSVVVISAIFWNDVRIPLVQFFAIDDPVRGLGTGLSGRLFFWSQTGAVTNGRELFGLGIATRDGFHLQPGLANNLHSGLLNAFAELGAIGLAIYIAVLAFAAIVWFRRAGAGCFEAACIAAYMVSMAPRLVFEPGYISFWHPPFVVMWAFIAGAAVKMVETDPDKPAVELDTSRTEGLSSWFKGSRSRKVD